VRADLSDPEQRYSFEREAEHLWILGETELALERLSARISPVPRDNLRRWRLWLPRVDGMFGPDNPDTLVARGNIAYSRRCFPIRSACSAPITRIRSRPGATSPTGPARAEMPRRPCG
jgi:hypothetical protein